MPGGIERIISNTLGRANLAKRSSEIGEASRGRNAIYVPPSSEVLKIPFLNPEQKREQEERAIFEQKIFEYLEKKDQGRFRYALGYFLEPSAINMTTIRQPLIIVQRHAKPDEPGHPWEVIWVNGKFLDQPVRLDSITATLPE